MKPKPKVVREGPKPRSNSFKLGSRPREVKDQVRKTYRRNSFTDIDNNRIEKDYIKAKTTIVELSEENKTSVHREH